MNIMTPDSVGKALDTTHIERWVYDTATLTITHPTLADLALAASTASATSEYGDPADANAFADHVPPTPPATSQVHTLDASTLEADGTEPFALKDVSAVEVNPRQFSKKAKRSSSKNTGRKLPIAWLNVTGLHSGLHGGLHGDALLKTLGEIYGLHPLTVEDIANPQHRAKAEAFDGYLYVVVRMLRIGTDGLLDNEQVSLVLQPQQVLVFEEKPGDVFDSVRERLRYKKGHLHKRGADYLCYCLLDAVVDEYFVVLEHYSNLAETLELAILEDDITDTTLAELNQMRRELLRIRRAIWPLRDVCATLLRDDTTSFFSKPVRVYLQDLHDHTIQVIDTTESLREVCTGLHDMYLSNLSYKMNEVMKVLTVISTIFMPLSFLVGVYGMNFAHMPELNSRYGYFVLWGIMIVITLAMLRYFKTRDWL